MKTRFLYLFSFLLFNTVYASTPDTLKVDQNQVDEWNDFVTQLIELHHYQLQNRPVTIKKSTGGYSTNPDFYLEERFFDKNSGRLLSRIQWEKSNPENIHLIEVNVYSSNGDLKYDYMAAYLPVYRNAPVQTLINLHSSDGELSAYRQFDASGARIYEQCSGRYFNNEVMVSLEEHEIPANSGVLPITVTEELYLACFNQLPASAEKLLSPRNLVKKNASTPNLSLELHDKIDRTISQLSNKIVLQADNATNYLARGKLFFEIHEFEKSINDLSLAIELDNNLDEAWFWRGMSRGRNSQLDEGIADLTVYLKRHPESSLGYTKRGVRYIWKGDLANARKDLAKAIRLDKNNAEAHDDLGVIYAQRGEIHTAIRHFTSTVTIDPSYQKGWHNLAMAEYISRNHDAALKNINQALKLSPDSKNALTLKGEILIALGRQEEGKRLLEEVDFLPEGNWSEMFPLK